MEQVIFDIDQRLITRFVAGEQTAFDALVERHRRNVFHVVRHLVGDLETAEEITLEIFVQAYISLPSYRRQANFSTWLHRIAINVTLQYLRLPRVKHASTEAPFNEELVGISESSDDFVFRKDTVERVIFAMQELPPVQRAAVILHYLQEMTFTEIAEVLDIPANTAKTRVFNGTKILRKKLEALDIFPAGRRKTN